MLSFKCLSLSAILFIPILMTKKWQTFPDILGDELLDRKRCHIMSVFSLTNA